MKHILHTSAASIITAATLLLAGAHEASAQVWQGVLTFRDACPVPAGGTIHSVAQTFTAPLVNPELRQIWALLEAQDGGGLDNANFFVVPWDDANSRAAGPALFTNNAGAIPPGPARRTITCPCPPIALTPGGRYAIVMSYSRGGAAIGGGSVGCDATDIFPGGSAFALGNVPPSGWATFPWNVVGTANTDIALQPAFTQPGPQKTVLLVGAKDGSGTPVPGSPGTTFASFGIPSQNSAGIHAFIANVRGPDGRMAQALCNNEVIEGVIQPVPSIRARKGDAVPGRPGVFFAGFKDPLLTEDGRIVVLATLIGTGITADNNMGIYTCGMVGSGLVGIANEGDEPPGVPGARIKSFRSLAASNGGIAWLYQMVSGPSGTAGPGGVTTANDLALAVSNSAFTVLGTPLIREGTNFAWDLDNDGIADDSGIVKSFSALSALAGAAGHGHGVGEVHDDGEIYSAVTFQARFTDGRVGNFSAGQDTRIDSLVVTGGTVAFNDGGDTGTHEVTSLGIPGQSSVGASAFVARFKIGIGGVTSANDVGVLMAGAIGEGASDVNALLVHEGTQPLGGGGATFSSFLSPVLRHLGDTGTHEVGHWIGFMAKLKGLGITSANDLCVSRMVGNQFAAVAREGGEAPGVPGSQFGSFKSIAFMDYTDDSCMNALIVHGNMRVGASGAPGPGGVTLAVDEGLWLFDHNGDGHIVIREGEQMTVGGVTRTVKRFIVISAVPFSPSQTRSHNAAGRIVLRSIFTDGTCAVIEYQDGTDSF